MAEDCTSQFNYNSIRRAAEVHRQVRAFARKTIRPGMTMTEIANLIEDGTRALVEENGMQSGIGFPTGLSLNHCAAHYSPNPGDTIGSSYRLTILRLLRLLTEWCSAETRGCDESRFRCTYQRADRRFSVYDVL